MDIVIVMSLFRFRGREQPIEAGMCAGRQGHANWENESDELTVILKSKFNLWWYLKVLYSTTKH